MIAPSAAGPLLDQLPAVGDAKIDGGAEYEGVGNAVGCR